MAMALAVAMLAVAMAMAVATAAAVAMASGHGNGNSTGNGRGNGNGSGQDNGNSNGNGSGDVAAWHCIGKQSLALTVMRAATQHGHNGNISIMQARDGTNKWFDASQKHIKGQVSLVLRHSVCAAQ